MKVRGNVLRARVAFVKERFGEQAWDKVLAALIDEDRKSLKGIITHGAWYPFEVSVRLDEAIVKVVGGGDTRIFEDIGRASAIENLTTVHARFLDPPLPQELLKKSPMVYQFYYDIGYRTYEQTGPNSGVLTTLDAETYSVPDCATVIGWYKQALEMCGAKDVVIVEDTCRARGSQVCRYVISWS
jgi:uncharacterized protein (TIGR02265 family)